MITAVKVNSSDSIADLTTILTVNRIQIKNEAGSKKRVLELVSRLIGQALPDCDYKAIFEQFITREKLGSTAIGHGVAIPHIRLDNIDQAVAAFVTLDAPVDFNGPSKLSADLIFALVVPANFEQQHLELLKAITYLLHCQSIREALRNSHAAAEVYTLLTGGDHDE